MSMNNLATHYERRFSGKNTIAAMCIERLSIGRDLIVGPGYIAQLMGDIPKPPSRNAKYFDVMGNRVTRKSIANQYSVCCSHVKNVFKRNDYNYELAHKELREKNS